MIGTEIHRIWIAGNYEDAVRAVKKWCDTRGDCYSISRCDFIFSGACEAGICVVRINYAKFPETRKQITAKITALALHLADSLYQKSYSIETPDGMKYIERKGPWSV